LIAGHFGFASIVKSRESRVPLWSLMLATVWLDIVFVPLLLMKIETMEHVPGLRGGYGQNIIHADYTHSLLGSLVLSAVFALMFVVPWGKRCAMVLGLVSFSHWALDLIVHRRDLPLLPGNFGHFPELGFGLWHFKEISASLELLLILLGTWYYWRAANEVALAAQRGRSRAIATAVLILFTGIAVLILDVTA
jgi:hypothetical protein